MKKTAILIFGLALLLMTGCWWRHYERGYDEHDRRDYNGDVHEKVIIETPGDQGNHDEHGNHDEQDKHDNHDQGEGH